MTPRLVIAGAHSSVGKTTLTTGLIAALSRRGLTVQPFKVGPDYIDPSYHTLAAGRPCRNLDTWMLSLERVRSLFVHATRDADMALVEGVMGLYDGAEYDAEAGSTAEVAKLLEAPVVLVLDCRSMARSAGAVALGYQQFDPHLRLVGFIANRVGSESHGRGVARAIEAATGLPVLGCLPRDEALTIPERHLGLTPTAEPGRWLDFIEAAAEHVVRYLDIERLLELARQAPSLAFPEADGLGFVWPRIARPEDRPAIAQNETTQQSTFGPRRAGGENCPAEAIGLPSMPATAAAPLIAVARDEAFSFTYPDNLDLLEAAGAELAYFSPLRDAELPRGAGGVLLSGGFPELYANRLAENVSMHESLRRAHARGLPIYAECGGLMYLTETLADLAGREHRMVGLLPGRSAMSGQLTLGYRLAEAAGDSWLLARGETVRGHEFHFSVWEGRPAELPPAYWLWPKDGQGDARPEGMNRDNLWASYVHLHFWGRPELAARFVAASRGGH